MKRRAPKSATRALVAALIALLASALFAGPIGAQTAQAEFEVLRVDLRGETGSVTLRPAVGEDGLDVGVSSGGKNLDPTVAPLGRSAVDAFTVLIVDDSTIADQVVGFSRVQEAALAYLDGLNSDTRVMLVRGGGGNPAVQAIVPFTADHATVRDAIREMSPGGGSVLWNSIARSADTFDVQGEGVRNVVAVLASTGSSSTIPATVAQGNLLNANAGLTVVAPEAVNLQIGSFLTVANTVRGGSIFRADEGTTIVDAASAAAASHESSLVATFKKSDIPDGAATLVVSHNGASERVRFTPDGLAAGGGLIAPDLPTTSTFDVLRGDNGAVIAIGLGVVAALLFSFAMMQIFAGNDDSLNSTLAVYGADDFSEEKRAADDAFASVRSKIVEQVVEKAESAAASRGNLQSTTSLLEKAEIPMRVGEAMAVQVGVIVASFALGFLVTRSPLGALVFVAPAAIMPSLYVKYRVKRRKKRLEAQLPDTLNLLSSTLKAGYSFIQGMDAVGNEAEEPLASEFRRTVNEARLGKDIDDALDDLSTRVGSVDLEWAIVAIKIQREVGGNLAELLTTVADTMTARERLRGEVAALTAEGKMSAYVLVFLPIAVGVAMYFMNPDYIATLWSHTFGYIAIGIGVLGMVVGSIWMRKIIDIKI